MLATAGSLATPPSSAALAAAALASRRSDPAIRGRIMVMRPKAATAAVLASQLTATAPLDCVMAPLSSSPLPPLALDKNPRPSSPAVAPDVLVPAPSSSSLSLTPPPSSASTDQLQCCPLATSSVEVVPESPGLGLAPCRSAGTMPSCSAAPTAPVAASGHVADPAASFAAAGCGGDARQCGGGGDARRHSCAEAMASFPASRLGAGSKEDVSRRWQDVPSRRRPHNSAMSTPPVVRCSRPATPAWLRDRCFRCLSRGHRARSCRNPIRCMSCLCFGHVARLCRAMPSIDESSPLRCAASSPLQPVVPSPAPADDATLTGVPLQHIPMEDVLLLHSQLCDCLAQVRSVLARAEDALGKLQTVPLLPQQVGSLNRVDVCAAYEHESSLVVEMMSETGAEAIVVEAHEESSVDGEDCFFGCFSPHASSSPQPMMPVVSQYEEIMQIMPELHELCGENSTTPPLSMVQLQVDSLGTSTVTSTSPLLVPSKTIDFIDCGVKVIEADALAPDSETLFAKELCNLLARLEAASPGSSQEIASLLTEKATMGKIKKVK